MTQSRTELIDIVGRILAGAEYWDDPRYHNDPNKDAYEVGELAKEIVTALRPEAKNADYWDQFDFDIANPGAPYKPCYDISEAKPPVKLNDWHPDCGGDWVLSGPGYFANYWPDNTVIADILDADDTRIASTGIQSFASRAECQAYAEWWIKAEIAARGC